MLGLKLMDLLDGAVFVLKSELTTSRPTGGIYDMEILCPVFLIVVLWKDVLHLKPFFLFSENAVKSFFIYCNMGGYRSLSLIPAA